MVEATGQTSNFSAIEELARWGAIIENMRHFSGDYNEARK